MSKAAPSRLLLAIATVAVTAPLALAGPKQEAKKHVAKATQLHKDGKFDEALVELQAAYKLDPKPDLLFAIAQVYAKLGDCQSATEYFEKFGKANKKSKQIQGVVKEAIAACQPIEKAPEPAPPPAPPPTPAEQKPDQDSPFAGGAAEKQPPEPTPTPTPEPTPSPTPTPAPGGGSLDAHASVTTHSRPFYTDKLGDVLFLGGVAGTVVGFLMYSGAKSELDSAEASATLADYQNHIDTAHSKRTESVIFFGVGGALLVGGILRYTMHHRHDGETRVGVAPTPHGGGVVTWMGRF